MEKPEHEIENTPLNLKSRFFLIYFKIKSLLPAIANLRAIALCRESDKASRELEPVSSADLFRYGNPRYDTNSAQLAALIIAIASGQ